MHAHCFPSLMLSLSDLFFLYAGFARRECHIDEYTVVSGALLLGWHDN
jgi:hypothetical protein